MKGNKKFFMIVTSLLILSSLVLTGCMYAISSNDKGAKQYDLDVMENVTDNDSESDGVFGEGILPQKELQEKFGIYIHTNENTATVFSEEQYAVLKSLREKGVRTPLTYDEVLFLINDSINLYFTYEEIKLTNAVCDGISHNLYLSTNAETIRPYHGDFSEFPSLDKGYQQYEKMIEDIFSIIYYRIYMHDAGFETVTEAFLPGKGTIVYTDEYEFDYDGNASIDPRETETGAVKLGIMQLLSFNGTDVSGKENKDHLVSEWGKMIRARGAFSSDYVDASGYVPEVLEAPMLVCYHENGILRDSRISTVLYNLYMVDPETLQSTSIFPTYELKNMMPTGWSMYVSGEIDGDKFGNYFALNEYLGTFMMSLSSSQSFALTGKYEEDGGVLKLYVENAEPEELCSYVFHYNGAEWVYSRKDSNPPSGSFDIEDGQKFRYARDELYVPYYEKPIANIRDMARENNIPTDTAMEKFFEDDEKVYYFPSVKSKYVIVTFADGTSMTVKEALEKGYIKIRALDVFSVYYIADKK